MTTPYRKPLPDPTPISQPFWDGTREGRLLIQRCDPCGNYRWTPHQACPWCLSDAYTWTAVSGRAQVYSVTVVHRPPDPVAFQHDVPYVVAVVRLDEGPHMQTNIVGCAPEEVTIGMPVVVQFERATEEITLYKFRPAR